MKFGKLSAVAVAAVVAVAGNVVAGGGYMPEASANGSDYMFWADAKTGYEHVNRSIAKRINRGAHWGVRGKFGVESTAGSLQGLGFEGRVGGLFGTRKKSRSAFEGGASLGWNLGSMMDSDMTFRPMVGYEHRYGSLNGVLVNLDLGTQFAEEHYVGVRGGLNFLFGHRAKKQRRIAYELAGLYNYKYSDMMGFGLEVGYRNYGTKRAHKNVHHYQVLAGVSFTS